MSDNQFLTVGDVYNPVDTALKVQAIDAAKIQNRIQAMKMREMYQQQKRKNDYLQAYNQPNLIGKVINPLTHEAMSNPGQRPPMQQINQAQPQPGAQVNTPNAQAMPPQVQQSPEISEEQKSEKRANIVMGSIMKNVQPLMAEIKNDPTKIDRINKMLDMGNNQPDVKKSIQNKGFDDFKPFVDENGIMNYEVTKNYTEDELNKIYEMAPYGQERLQPLLTHPAKYKITTDDKGGIKNVEFVSGLELIDKNLTREQLAARALYGPISDRAKYKAILEETRKTGENISNGLSQDAIELEAERIVAGEKLGNYGYGKAGAAMKAAVINRTAAIAKERGMDATDIIAQGAELAGQKGGMKNIIQREVSIGTFVKRIDATSDYVMKMAKEIGSKDSRLLNIPRNQIVKFIGSGKYRAYELALYSLSAEIAKVETGQLGISAITDTQLKIMNGIHDPNLSIAELQNLINGGKVLGKTAMDSIKGYRKELKAEISENSNKDSKPSGDDPLGLR